MSHKWSCVLLADRHQGLRDGVRGLLETEFDTVFMVATEASLLEGVRRLNAAIAVVDLSLSDGDLRGLLTRIEQRAPGTKVLLLSVHDERSVAERRLCRRRRRGGPQALPGHRSAAGRGCRARRPALPLAGSRAMTKPPLEPSRPRTSRWSSAARCSSCSAAPILSGAWARRCHAQRGCRRRHLARLHVGAFCKMLADYPQTRRGVPARSGSIVKESANPMEKVEG